PLFWLLDAFAMSGFGLPLRTFSIALHQPLAVLGFGLIGLAMRGRALDPEVQRAPSGWLWFTPEWARGAGYACVLVALSALFAGRPRSTLMKPASPSATTPRSCRIRSSGRRRARRRRSIRSSKRTPCAGAWSPAGTATRGLPRRAPA